MASNYKNEKNENNYHNLTVKWGELLSLATLFLFESFEFEIKEDIFAKKNQAKKALTEGDEPTATRLIGEAVKWLNDSLCYFAKNWVTEYFRRQLVKTIEDCGGVSSLEAIDLQWRTKEYESFVCVRLDPERIKIAAQKCGELEKAFQNAEPAYRRRMALLRSAEFEAAEAAKKAKKVEDMKQHAVILDVAEEAYYSAKRRRQQTSYDLNAN